MKKTFVAAALIVSLVIFIRVAHFRLAPTPRPEGLRLGATIPLTGPAASYGKEIREGIELALTDLEREGIRAQITYQDVSLPGPMAVSAIRSLVDQHEVEAVVANFYNPAIPVMAPAIMRAKTITFHTAEADDKILAAGDYIFSTNARIKDESAEMAAFAHDRLAAKTAAVLYVGTTFGEHYNLHFTKQFESRGGQVIHNGLVAIEERDMRPALLQALARKPQLLVLANFGPGLGLMLKQAFAMNIEQPVLTVYEAENTAVIETAGSLPNDRVHFFSPQPAQPAPHVSSFREAFQKRFGAPPTLFSANAYDATVLSARALTGCSRDRSCAQRKIAATQSYPGVSGTLSFGPDGGATKEFVRKTIRGEEFVTMGSN